MDLFKDISPRSGGGEVPSQVRGAPFGGGDAARLGGRRATPMGHAGYPPRHADAEHAAYRTFRGGGSAFPPQLWIDLLATVDNGDNFVHNPVDLWTGFFVGGGCEDGSVAGRGASSSLAVEPDVGKPECDVVRIAASFELPTGGYPHAGAKRAATRHQHMI